MVFDEEPKQIVHEVIAKNLIPKGIVTSFDNQKSHFIHSLQRMKSSMVCDLKKTIVEGILNEYVSLFAFQEESPIADSRIEHKYAQSIVYHKQQYYKVIKEQEYLEQITALLNSD